MPDTPFLLDLLRRSIAVEWAEDQLIAGVVYNKPSYALVAEI